jgi:hypothetical protein
MQKRMKTEKDYDAALDAIDCEIVEYTKAAEKLEAKRRALQNKKRAKFDPEYRAVQERIRKANAERKRFIADAAKKFVGKWLFIDDGTYIHVIGVDAPTKESTSGDFQGEGYLVFPTHYDISVVAGDGNIKISNGTSKNHGVVYLTLYAEDVIKASKKDVMEDLESKLGEMLSDYKALCKRIKWKPSVGK